MAMVVGGGYFSFLFKLRNICMYGARVICRTLERKGARLLAIFVCKASRCLKEGSAWEHRAQKGHLLNLVHVWACHPHKGKGSK